MLRVFFVGVCLKKFRSNARKEVIWTINDLKNLRKCIFKIEICKFVKNVNPENTDVTKKSV